VRKSPLAKGGDFFMNAAHEIFASGDLFTITVCDKIVLSLFSREKFAPSTATATATGRFFDVVNKTLLS